MIWLLAKRSLSKVFQPWQSTDFPESLMLRDGGKTSFICRLNRMLGRVA
jgi:hypothetical protein